MWYCTELYVSTYWMDKIFIGAEPEFGLALPNTTLAPLV